VDLLIDIRPEVHAVGGSHGTTEPSLTRHGTSSGSGGFGNVTEALRAGDIVAGYLNSPAAAGLDGGRVRGGADHHRPDPVPAGRRAGQPAGPVRRRQRPRRRRVRHHRRLAGRQDPADPQGRQGHRPADAAPGKAPAAGRRHRDRGAITVPGPRDRRVNRAPPSRGAAAAGRPDPAGRRGGRGGTWMTCGSSPRPPTRPGGPSTPTPTTTAGTTTGTSSSTPPWTTPAGSPTT